MRESFTLRNNKHTAIFVASLAGIAALGTGVATEVNRTDAVATFTDRYTDDGKCLDGTDFDPAKGAHVVSEDGEVYVIPKRPNFVDPSVLVLSVEGHGLGRPTFTPADYPSAGLLFERHCPGASDGM